MLRASLALCATTLASPVPPPPVVSEAYCTEARADFLGFYLKEDDASGARIGVDLRLAAVAEDCGPEGRGAEHVELLGVDLRGLARAEAQGAGQVPEDLRPDDEPAVRARRRRAARVR